MMDILMITKNSVQPCLEESLRSIEEALKEAQITARLIVVDGGSLNGSLEIIERHSGALNPLVVFEGGNRATARQVGFELVESEFVAVIDSDVVLTGSWFSQMLVHFEDPRVGAVWGATLQVAPMRKKYVDAMARLYGENTLEKSRRYGEKRGCLHDTMIRAEAIRDIEIPEELHVMEDHFVRKYVERGGWLWVSTDAPFVYHNMGENDPRDAYLDAYHGGKLGLYPRAWYLKHLALSWAKLGYLLLVTRDAGLVWREAVKEYYFVRASLRLFWEWVF